MNFLRKIALIASVSTCFAANAALIQVSQGNTVLRTIESYYGTDSAADNYKTNKHPIIGPEAATDAFHAFFYENPVDGMTANFFFTGNEINPDDNKQAKADVVASTSGDASVLFSDEPHEFVESTTDPDNFIGSWWYLNDLADGAAMGGLEGLWSVSFTFTQVDPTFTSFFAYGSDGNSLAVDPTQTILFSAIPSTSANSVNSPSVLLMFGLASMLIGVRRFKTAK